MSFGIIIYLNMNKTDFRSSRERILTYAKLEIVEITQVCISLRFGNVTRSVFRERR